MTSKLHGRVPLFAIVFMAFGLSLGGPLTTLAQSMTEESTPVASSNPLSGNPEAIEKGGKLYAKWCLGCHGPKADGVSPRFGKYAGDLTKFWRGYGEFLTIVLNGRTKKQMPPWAEVLSIDEISQIGAFLETRAVDGANWK